MDNLNKSQTVTVDDILAEYKEALQVNATGGRHPLESEMCCSESR